MLATVAVVLVVGGLVAAAFARESGGPIRGEPMTSAGADDSMDASSVDAQPTVPSAPQPAGRSGARTETFVVSSPRTETFEVLDVGTVTLEIADLLRLADVQPARPGWRVEVQTLGREVEVSFRGDGQRVDWKAEHEDGQVRVRVHDRRAEDSRRGRG